MKYRFKGKDGSMGYKKGKTYRGKIVRQNNKVYFLPGFFPFNLRELVIPYDTVEAFNNNWEKT